MAKDTEYTLEQVQQVRASRRSLFDLLSSRRVPTSSQRSSLYSPTHTDTDDYRQHNKEGDLWLVVNGNVYECVLPSGQPSRR